MESSINRKFGDIIMDTFIYKCNEQVQCNHALTLHPGIFFDRDGTIIAEKNYLKDIRELKLLPGAVKALKMLQFLNIPCYLITNQAGIAHGYFNETQLNEIHHYLLKVLNKAGIKLRGILYCPHHPHAEISEFQKDCNCRKPNPGLLYKAAEIDGVDLNSSYMLGDKLIDITAGKNGGLKTILMLTGYGRKERLKMTPELTPDYIASDLPKAVAWILKDFYSNQCLTRFHRKIKGAVTI